MLEDRWTDGPVLELSRAVESGRWAVTQTLDRLLAERSMIDVLREAVLPYVSGSTGSPAAEAMTSAPPPVDLLREWLLSRARGWGHGRGPRTLLACVPGDRQDVPLICFGLALRAHGWRITYLGPEIPIETLLETAELLAPAQVVVGAGRAQLVERAGPDLRELAEIATLALAGEGASLELADSVGARYLGADPVTAAALTAALQTSG